MKSVEESLREIITFSEKQLAAEIRRLEKDGQDKNNVKADAYTTIINVLRSMLPGKREKKDNDAQE